MLGSVSRSAIFASLVLATSVSAQVPESLTFAAAVERALGANPTLVAARLRRAIDVAGVGVARERLNPEMRVEFERETPTRAYTLALPLEIGGKRARRIELGEATVRAGEAEFQVTVLEVRSSVRRAYFRTVISEARTSVLDEVSAFATRSRDAARDRFQAGSVPRLDLLQAELALAQVENDAIAARAAARAARTQLNALLALPLDSRIPLSTSIDVASLEPADAAVARALSSSAELTALDRRLEEQRAKLALARALQVPDVTPEAALTRGAEPEFDTGWRAAVSVSLPLFTRHRAGVDVEQAAITQLTADRTAAAARISGEVASAATLAEAQRQQYVKYRDQILPQALEVERMAEDSYRLGQTGIAALLQALQASRDARLRSLQAAADFQNALADLERVIGVPIP
jgi:cobalt-zinc-cadmium efflux system outer membrane protein